MGPSLITHCINLISSDIIKVNRIKSLIKCVNSVTKNSHLVSMWLKEAIQLKRIEGRGLKTYVETC